MDRYQLALYVHFLAIVATVAAAAILQFNFSRLRRTTRVSEARDAAGALARIAPLMPLFALALFASGAYLVSLRWTWSQGWVIAGIVGLFSMPLSGVLVQKPRLGAVGRRLAQAKDASIDADLTAAIRDRLLVGAVSFNHVMALAVMFVMVTKPGIAGAFITLLAAPVVAVWSAFSSSRAPVDASSSAAVSANQ